MTGSIPRTCYRIVSIGDLVADLIVSIPELPVIPDVHQIAEKFTLEPGGAGNFLIAGSRLGMEMVALGTIGEDLFGSAVIDALEENGVSTAGVVQQAGTNSTTVIVLVDAQGQHVFLGGYGVGPSIGWPHEWAELVRDCDAVFASGYTFQEQRLEEGAIRSMQYARELGIPVFFDPGPDMVHLPHEQAQLILSASDVLLLTEEEIPILTGGHEGIRAARNLLREPVRMVCVKRGAMGCTLLIGQDRTVSHPGFKVPVRDTTAAGDSFAAAFIYAWLEELPPEQIAAFANAMGAAKVQKVGSGSQVPTMDELRQVLNEFNIRIDI